MSISLTTEQIIEIYTIVARVSIESYQSGMPKSEVISDVRDYITKYMKENETVLEDMLTAVVENKNLSIHQNPVNGKWVAALMLGAFNSKYEALEAHQDFLQRLSKIMGI